MEQQATKKELPKVEGANVTAKKPSAAKKIAGSIIAEDAKTVGNYILFDVVIPSIKDTISSIVSNGIDMLLFGEGGRSRKRSSTTSNIFGVMNYNSISTDKAKRASSITGSGARPVNSYDRVQASDLIFETRAKCQEAIYKAHDVLDEYPLLSIADLYEICGLSEISVFTDNKYGWDRESFKGAEPVRLGDGTYLLKLPKVKALD